MQVRRRETSIGDHQRPPKASAVDFAVRPSPQLTSEGRAYALSPNRGSTVGSARRFRTCRVPAPQCRVFAIAQVGCRDLSTGRRRAGHRARCTRNESDSATPSIGLHNAPLGPRVPGTSRVRTTLAVRWVSPVSAVIEAITKPGAWPFVDVGIRRTPSDPTVPGVARARAIE